MLDTTPRWLPLDRGLYLHQREILRERGSLDAVDDPVFERPIGPVNSLFAKESCGRLNTQLSTVRHDPCYPVVVSLNTLKPLA